MGVWAPAFYTQDYILYPVFYIQTKHSRHISLSSDQWENYCLFPEIQASTKPLKNGKNNAPTMPTTRPSLCKTLYRKPMQAPNFGRGGGGVDQLSFWNFLCSFHTKFLSTFFIPLWKVKISQKPNQGGGDGGSCLNISSLVDGWWASNLTRSYLYDGGKKTKQKY